MSFVATVWLSRDTTVLSAKIGLDLHEWYGVGDRYASINAYKEDADALGRELESAYRKLIPLTAIYPTLHCVAVLPLWTADLDERMQILRRAVADSRNRLSVHVVALSSNLAKVFGISQDHVSESDDRRLIEKLSLDTDGALNFTWSLVEDYAANGASFNFTAGTLGDYLGVFLHALVRDYDTVLPSSTLIDNNEHNLYGIGVSALRFDEQDAVNYLLHRAFMSKLTSQKVDGRKVDTQQAINRAQLILAGAQRHYEDFYETKVMPLYREDKLSEEDVAAKARELLNADMNGIEQELTSFIHDDNLTFIEKEAVLSLLLGRDSDLLSGAQYESDNLIVDDFASQPLELYIDTYNQLAEGSGMLPVRGDYPEIKEYCLDSRSGKTVESPVNKYAFNPLPEIKKLKQQICNNTEFIRRKTEELENLRKAEAREKVIKEQKRGTPDDIHRNVTAEVREHPLDDKYTPPADIKILPSVDLRRYFSPVKNQGQIGSCASFAVTAIYESIINRAAGETAEKADMSERFLFYWSNVIAGHPEGGSNYSEQLAVAGKHGLCREAMYPYILDELSTPPDMATQDEASQHRVVKALQIPLCDEGNVIDCVNHNHRLLTSALTEGYPVGISLKVYDSFETEGAFISRPDEDDIASGGEGYHAMVLVGYSENTKCYIVRNSWGTGWGNKGYAYISASYIDDPAYNNFACIITETTEQQTNVEIPQMAADFGLTESEIKIGSLQSILDEAKLQLGEQTRMYREYYRYYSDLLVNASLPATQSQLRKLAEKDCVAQMSVVEDKLMKLKEEYVPSIKNFKQNYIKIGCGLSFVTLLWALLNVVTVMREHLWCWIVAGVAVTITVFYWINYYWSWRRHRRTLQEDIDDVTVKLRKTRSILMEKQLKYHIAGMWMSDFNGLLNKLGATLERLVSFNDKLHSWYAQDAAALSQKPRHAGAMFIYLGNTDLYDKYFDDNIREITSRIDLMRVFSNYNVSGESMVSARKRLDDETREAIHTLFGDFSMLRYLMGQTYPYTETRDLAALMKHIALSSQPSVRHDMSDATATTHNIFVYGDNNQISELRAKITPFFSYPPQILGAAPATELDIVSIQLIPITTIRQ